VVISLDVVTIPGGSFLMGAEQGQENERPCHRVRVDAFALGRYPITRREYQTFIEATGMAPPPFYTEPMFAYPEKPIVGVNWHDAAAYCAWLGGRTGREVRLPTEAEWERAARGHREGALYPWGDESPAEKLLIGCDPELGGPAKVGINPPNDFGLYDMRENVHEWCSDYYDYNYYRHAPERNPRGPANGTRRASRGGSWRHRIQFSRCAARSSLPPNFQYADYGFRVAVTI
jgi:formylglycine-generating enzyme required for sulfatase activity